MKLICDGVTKSYGTNLALSDFRAELEPGVYALLGPNGSGKTTLMNILTGNLRADSGKITLDGEDIRAMGRRWREKLGYMPQYPGLYPNFTVERFLWYTAALKGLPRAEAKRQIEEKLAAVELSDVARRKIGALSGGMKQRLTLAQAVLGDPAILILDEPTAGLDPKQRISIRNYIAKISFEKIVLIATHVVPDIEFIARDVILLKKGVVVDQGAPHTMTQKMEGRVWIVPCAESEVTAMQNRFRVTDIVRDDVSGAIRLRVLAPERPAENALPAAPLLEDYYLDVFGGE